MLEQVAEAGVRLLGGAEARVLADRPRPLAVHPRVRPARERKLAGWLELDPGDVVRRVDRLDLDPRVGLPAIVGRHGRNLRYVHGGRVRLFAGLRERAGTGERRLELPEGSCVADTWAPLGLGEQPAGLLYAVNREYAPRDTPLSAGDEVALIPPVSGGAFRLTDEPLDPAAVIREVSDPRAGGIATFIGTTRAESRGRTVHYLDYEAYGGMAEQMMAELADQLRRKHDLCELAIAPPDRTRGHRRDIGGDRGLRPAPRGGARRLPGGNRHAQGDRAALEEGGLRGRRGVDRARLVTAPELSSP